MAERGDLTVADIRVAKAEAQAQIAQALESFSERVGVVPAVEILHETGKDGRLRYHVSLRVSIE